jgi:hypothetical protein
LTLVPDAVREIVQRHLPDGVPETADQLALDESVGAALSPADFAWAAWLKRQSPLVQILFLLLLFAVLTPLLEALWHSAVERWMHSGSSETRIQIVQEVRQNFGLDYASRLRCVRGSGVNVRAAPSKDAKVVGRLSSGQSVEVTESIGAFTHIRYRDETSGETREGWAASGYLVNVAC